MHKAAGKVADCHRPRYEPQGYDLAIDGLWPGSHLSTVRKANIEKMLTELKTGRCIRHRVVKAYGYIGPVITNAI